ncbi:DNA-binding transcriptional activator GcvA [compost metagenome]
MALGWDHLVAPLIEEGRLVRPVEQEMVLEETRHYLAYREDRADDDALTRFRNWFMDQSSLPTTT